MNKKLVNELLPSAVAAIQNGGFIDPKTGKIDHAFRSQISSFGAAVSMGSLLSATAFFNQQQGASVDRKKLMDAINRMMKEKQLLGQNFTCGGTLFDTVCKALNSGLKEHDVTEVVMACAVALKLSLNLFKLTKEKADSKDKSSQKDTEEEPG